MPAETIVFDLDSTLADTSQRHHIIDQIHADPPTANWVDYSMACADDTPIEGVIKLLNLLSTHFIIVIVTGRSILAREETEAWLSLYKVNYARLIMRPVVHQNEHTHSNAVWKKLMMLELRQEGYRIVLFIDDWPDCAREAAKIGIQSVITVPTYNWDKIQADLR